MSFCIMVANVMHSNCWRYFDLLKGPNPSYVALNGNILPVTKWEVAQNEILHLGHDLERSR